MKTLTAMCFGMLAAVAMAAAPVATITDINQATSRRVTVVYSLSVDAIVTADIQTNDVSTGAWASIGGANFTTGLKGQIQRKVQAGSGRSFTWQPRNTWAGRSLEAGTLRVVLTAHALWAAPDYMVVNLTEQNDITWYVSESDVPYGVSDDINKTYRMVMRRIPAAGATGQMGMSKMSGFNYVLIDAVREKPRTVSFTNDWYACIYPVTYRQYCQMTGGAPAQMFQGDTLAVAAVGYTALRGATPSIDWPATGHAVADGSALKKMRDLTGLELDLPTEAQWEFTCRAGTVTTYYNGDLGSGRIGEIAWYQGNCTNESGVASQHPVGLKQPNDWGIHDMCGNLYEMCLDYWVQNNSTITAGIDPVGPTAETRDSTARVTRAGAYNSDPALCTSSARSNSGPDGSYTKTFRLVCPATF
ncbi:MAG: formylglycine-generating enzyme family protein [Kiritimatiellae bacterium]|nr:formylglycine-generating enzyme family protein [Kiritimatiellia bacterium]